MKPPATDLLNLLCQQQWAITEDALEAIIRMAEQGDRLTVAPDTAQLPAVRKTTTRDGVAVIPVQGALSKHLSFMGFLFGHSTYAGIRAQVEKALTDDDTRAILLAIDSPGGTVAGVKELADFLREADRVKPVYAYADGLMASAAYWLGSAAREIAAPATALVGSIGILTTHMDASRADEKAGLKVTYISTGRYKTMGNSAEPLSDEARTYIKGRLDNLFGIFLNAVADHRNVSQEKALEMADEARLYLAGQAQTAGLIDRVTPGMDAYINIIREKEGIKPMDLNEFKTKHPELFTQCVDQGRQQAEETFQAREAAIGQSHTDALLALVKTLFGEEAHTRLSAVVASGVTPEQITALKDALPAASGKDDAKAKILAALQAAGNQGLDPAEFETDTGKDKPEAFLKKVTEHMQANNCSRGTAMQAVSAAHPDLHEAWVLSRQKSA